MNKTVYFAAVLVVFIPLLADAQDLPVAGNLTMEDSTATVGNVLKEDVPFIHNFGERNTFIGLNAGNLMLTGSYNTGAGFEALFANTTGFDNTSVGGLALRSNIGGAPNPTLRA